MRISFVLPSVKRRRPSVARSIQARETDPFFYRIPKRGGLTNKDTADHRP